MIPEAQLSWRDRSSGSDGPGPRPPDLVLLLNPDAEPQGDAIGQMARFLLAHTRRPAAQAPSCAILMVAFSTAPFVSPACCSSGSICSRRARGGCWTRA